MRDWSDFLEGFTIENGNLDPLMDKCREYITLLEEHEIYEFHDDFAPFYEGVMAEEVRLKRLYGENWFVKIPRKKAAEFLMVSIPIKCLIWNSLQNNNGYQAEVSVSLRSFQIYQNL